MGSKNQRQAKQARARATNPAPVALAPQKPAKGTWRREASIGQVHPKPAAIKLTPQERARLIEEAAKTKPKPPRQSDEEILREQANKNGVTFTPMAHTPESVASTSPTPATPSQPDEATVRSRFLEALRQRQAAIEKPALGILASAGVSREHADIGVIADAYRDMGKLWERLRAERRAALSALAIFREAGFEEAESKLGNDLLATTRALVAVDIGDSPGSGRPHDVGIDTALQFAHSRGWDWEVCAAAVFLHGADKRSYAAIKKSFRDCETKTRR